VIDFHVEPPGGASSRSATRLRRELDSRPSNIDGPGHDPGVAFFAAMIRSLGFSLRAGAAKT